MNITIRLATPADVLACSEVHKRSWEAAYKDIISADYIATKNATRDEQWQRMITDCNDIHYVIQMHEQIVGILTIGPSRDEDADDSFYEVHGIYLHPDYYRHGIGTAAMDYSINKARSLNKSIVTVWVFADNFNSIRFYEKCGFAPDGATDTNDYGGIKQSIRMRRNLL